MTLPLYAAEFADATFTAADGQTLPAQLLSPDKHDSKVPLVIFLHGAGERGTDNKAQLKAGAPLFQKSQDRFPCYVLAPQCPPNQKWVDWDWSKTYTVQPAEMTAPTKLLVQMLDAFPQAHPDVDLDRVYITGLSMGGFGTWDLVTRFPERFAAAIPICGGADPSKAPAISKLPIWTFHGDRDTTVPLVQTQTMVAALEKAGGHPLYNEYIDVQHDSWSNAYKEPELLAWLFAQRRGQEPVPFAKIASPFAQPPLNFFPHEGPLQTGTWFRPVWQTRRQQWAKDVAKDQGAIVFLGDSITQGWETLARDFSTRKVANRGISGDTTRGVLYRLQEDVIAVKPRAVSILIGTNDIGLHGTPEIAATNLQTIIAELHRADPKMPIVLNQIMPSTPAKSRPPEKLQKLNELYAAAFANDPLVTIVDTYTLFANDEGNAKLEEFPDLLHPNATGCAKWQALLDSTFTKLGL